MNMIDSGWDQSINDFLEQAGSESPTPGGGSVASLAAALGAAMASMAANLSQGEKFTDVLPQMKNTAEQMSLLSKQCEELLSADIAAFDAYMDALKLPKETDADKAARSLALRQATIHAIDVPLKLMTVCLDGLRCSEAIVLTTNKNVISDLGISLILFEAAAQSALLTVEINLAAMKDEALKQPYEERSLKLMTEISKLKNEALSAVRSRM